eukprot:3628470-Amphidinium_carterae.1
MMLLALVPHRLILIDDVTQSLVVYQLDKAACSPSHGAELKVHLLRLLQTVPTCTSSPSGARVSSITATVHVHLVCSQSQRILHDASLDPRSRRGLLELWTAGPA